MGTMSAVLCKCIIETKYYFTYFWSKFNPIRKSDNYRRSFSKRGLSFVCISVSILLIIFSLSVFSTSFSDKTSWYKLKISFATSPLSNFFHTSLYPIFPRIHMLRYPVAIHLNLLQVLKDLLFY